MQEGAVPVTLEWISFDELRGLMLRAGEPLYGIPTYIASDVSGRVYTWPFSYRLTRT